jgi:hypothetical protein
MNSVMSAGYQGMQQSQLSMERYAQDIASSNIESRNHRPLNASTALPSEAPIDAAKRTANAGAPIGEVPAAQNVQTSHNNSQSSASSDRSLAENLIAIRQQEQIFSASAKVVKVGAEAVGSLIDDYS